MSCKEQQQMIQAACMTMSADVRLHSKTVSQAVLSNSTQTPIMRQSHAHACMHSSHILAYNCRRRCALAVIASGWQLCTVHEKIFLNAACRSGAAAHGRAAKQLEIIDLPVSMRTACAEHFTSTTHAQHSRRQPWQHSPAWTQQQHRPTRQNYGRSREVAGRRRACSVQ
jgi:hypothetical protein